MSFFFGLDIVFRRGRVGFLGCVKLYLRGIFGSEVILVERGWRRVVNVWVLRELFIVSEKSRLMLKNYY